MSQHSAPTLQLLEASLKQPLDQHERHSLEEYSQQRFQATPQTVLTVTQTQDLLNLLFSRRADRAEKVHEQPLAASEIKPQPIWSPFVASLPSPLQPLAQRPLLGLFVALVVITLLLWLVL